MLNSLANLSEGQLTNLMAVVLAALAACLCAVILALLLETGLAWRLAVDHPNERSLHERPTPRCGGWGIVFTLLLILSTAAPAMWPISTGLLLLACVSALDDRGNLAIGWRLAAQIAAVAGTMAWMVHHLAWWDVVVCGLLWLWSINLYNFMDGADGLAGAMTLVGFSCYAIAAGTPNPGITTASVAAGGAALGFLMFNRPPAKLFLGDVGSIPLGFLAGAIGILGWRQGDWPPWFPLIVFSPFVADATATLFRRLLRRERFWLPHRQHYYQRLIQSGVSHGSTTLMWLACMVAAAALALYLRVNPPRIQWMGIGAWCVILIAAGMSIDRRWAKSHHRSANVPDSR